MVFRCLKALALFVFVSAQTSYACSIDWHFTTEKVSDHLSEFHLVVDATVSFTGNRGLEDNNAERLVGLRINQVIHSSSKTSPDFIVADYYSLFAPKCGQIQTHFIAGESNIVFVEKTKNGRLQVVGNTGRYASGKYIYSRSQLDDYLKKGIDSVLLSEGCAVHIKEAFDYKDVFGEIKFAYKECEAAISTYKKMFMSGSK